MLDTQHLTIVILLFKISINSKRKLSHPKAMVTKMKEKNSLTKHKINQQDASLPGFSEQKKRKREHVEKIGNQVFDVLCIISGLFFLGVYIPYFLWQSSKGRIPDILASLLVFTGVLIPFFLRKFLKKKLKKAYIPLKAVWCGGMCFYMVSFLIFCGVIYGHRDIPHTQSEKQQIVMVFGCQVHQSGVLSAELHSRLEKASDLLTEYPNAICVVSGGQGADEPTSEGWAMKNYLVNKKGFSEERILSEERSTNTIENVKYSIDVLKENGYASENCSFICVSSKFHTPRIYLLCTKFGISDCATASADSPYPFLEFIYTVREYMSYVNLLIFGT